MRTVVHVIGYIKEEKVIGKVFDVSADECHVYPVTDTDQFKIVLDLK